MVLHQEIQSVHSLVQYGTWEVPAACPQRVPHWGHAQDDVEIVGALVDKVLPDVLLGWPDTHLQGLITKLAQDRLFLLVRKQCRNNACDTKCQTLGTLTKGSWKTLLLRLIRNPLTKPMSILCVCSELSGSNKASRCLLTDSRDLALTAVQVCFILLT